MGKNKKNKNKTKDGAGEEAKAGETPSENTEASSAKPEEKKGSENVF